MAKKPTSMIKLQVQAGKASKGPPVGPILGQAGLNVVEFINDFNERTKNQEGMVIPVVISVYADRSFTFVTKTPPAATLLKKAAGLAKASGRPNTEKLGRVSEEQVRQIAEMKMQDLGANDTEAAVRMIEGTARSMGILVGEDGEIFVKPDEPELVEGETAEGEAKEKKEEGKDGKAAAEGEKTEAKAGEKGKGK